MAIPQKQEKQMLPQLKRQSYDSAASDLVFGAKEVLPPKSPPTFYGSSTSRARDFNCPSGVQSEEPLREFPQPTEISLDYLSLEAYASWESAVTFDSQNGDEILEDVDEVFDYDIDSFGEKDLVSMKPLQ